MVNHDPGKSNAVACHKKLGFGEIDALHDHLVGGGHEYRF